jgi:hypothetical protein
MEVCSHSVTVRTESDESVCTQCGLVLDPVLFERPPDRHGIPEGVTSWTYEVRKTALALAARLGFDDMHIDLNDVLLTLRRLRARGPRFSKEVIAAALVQARLPEVPGYRIRASSNNVSLSNFGRACALLGLDSADNDAHVAARYESARLQAPAVATTVVSSLQQCTVLGVTVPRDARNALTRLHHDMLRININTVSGSSISFQEWNLLLGPYELELHIAWCASGREPGLVEAHRRARGVHPAACCACRLEAERLGVVWYLEHL